MNTLMAKKANRIIDIVPEKKDEYIAMGYTIMDSTGKVINEPASTTIDEYKRENIALKKKLTAAENKLSAAEKTAAELKAENDALKAAAEKKSADEKPAEKA